MKWARARLVGGSQYMTFSWHESEEDCRAECIRRREELRTAAVFVPIYFPDGRCL